MSRPVVLYDGVCGLCNRFLRFLIRRDKRDQLRFAALQSEIGRQVLERHGYDPAELNTVLFVENIGEPGEIVRIKARAALRAITLLGSGWKLLAALRIVPAILLNIGYDLIARNRYRLFGRLDACPIPSAQDQAKFL